jgi:hypothetical protein
MYIGCFHPATLPMTDYVQLSYQIYYLCACCLIIYNLKFVITSLLFMAPIQLPKDFKHKFFFFNHVPMVLTLGASSNQIHEINYITLDRA